MPQPHPRLLRAATLPVGRSLLAVLCLEWAVVAGLHLAGSISASVAWVLAALAITSTLFLLTAYDAVIEAVHLYTGAPEPAAPPRFQAAVPGARGPHVRFARRLAAHLAWPLFLAGILAGHWWWR